jgi:hypothetical protein
MSRDQWMWLQASVALMAAAAQAMRIAEAAAANR